MKVSSYLSLELRPFRARTRFLLLNCLACVSAGLLLASLLPKRFVARASILPPANEQSGMGNSSLTRGLSLPGVQLPPPVSPSEMLMPALESERLRAAVARRVDIRRVYGIRDSLDALTKLRKESHFTITPRDLLEIEVKAPSARDAADLANAYAEELDPLLRSFRLKRARQTRESLERRLAETRTRLDSLQDRLAGFRRTHHVQGGASGAGDGVSVASPLLEEREELRVALQVARSHSSDSSQEVRLLSSRLKALETQLDRAAQLGSEPESAVRDLEVGEKVYGYLTAQCEGARLEEARDLAALESLDRAEPPRRPTWPRLRWFGVGSLLIGLLLGLGWAHADASDSSTPGGESLMGARGLVLLAASELALLALGAWLGWLPAAVAGTAGVVLWRMGPDFRWPFVAALGAGVFTVYGSGELTRELSIVTAFGVLAGALGLREFALRKWSLPRNSLTLALSLWFGVALYGVVLGLVRENSLKHLGVDASGAFGLLPALIAPLWRARRRAFLAVVGAYTILSYASAAFGLVAFIRYRRRIGDAWFGPLPAMGALLLISIAIHAPRRTVRWAALLLTPVLLLHQLLSFTRGYWLGFLVGLIAVFVVMVAGSRNRWRAAMAAAGATLGVGLLAGGAFLAAQTLVGGDLGASVGSRFESSFSTQTNTSTMSNIVRLAEWSVAMNQISRNPVLGYGAGATVAVQDPFTGTRNDQPYIHQMYILQWFKYGLAGLFSLLVLLWTFSRAGWREGRTAPTWQRRTVGTAVLANTLLMAFVCTSNFTLNMAFASPPLAFLWGLLLPVSGPEGQNCTDWQA